MMCSSACLLFACCYLLPAQSNSLVNGIEAFDRGGAPPEICEKPQNRSMMECLVSILRIGSWRPQLRAAKTVKAEDVDMR